jgi:LysM repeat protein
VQSGDTLVAIATRFGVDLQELARVNNISDPANIEVGRVLIIPSGSPQPTATAQPTPTLTPTRTATPSPTPQAGACTDPYIVQSGDYPGLIAQKCGVDVNALMQINGITDPTSLRIGQQLRLPPR